MSGFVAAAFAFRPPDALPSAALATLPFAAGSDSAAEEAAAAAVDAAAADLTAAVLVLPTTSSMRA